MMIAVEYGLAFLGGILGTALGMTGTFVVYGMAGLLGCLFLNDGYQTYILGILLAPYVMFMGMGSAMAYAAANKRYQVPDGMDSLRRLFGKHDLTLYLIAGCTAVLSHALKSCVTAGAIPVDTGAFSIICLSLVIRKVVARDTIITAGSDFAKHWKEHLRRNFTSLIVFSVLVTVVTFFITKWSGNFQLCFFISAFSLVGSLWTERGIPATHHISMVVGYAVAEGCSLFACLMLGVAAHILCNAMSYLVNYARFQTEEKERLLKYGSQIDPPAITIASLSFLIFAWL